ncbi:hypothetical protein GCM10010300_79800 [Streptomyces olivaceoviridis]|uniref:hypothetical protein n=1 Tax=Streptomyces olivaceoviridis TaxID=1921 RepID=UPI00167A7B34|nr:hypothetical protein [Streptomyces olivaceoviridis]GGZ24329.1 hypothetical protein GCM10010300_79800 [Streptomyces olivaceoviridis]
MTAVRLVSTIDAPLDPGSADAPALPHRTGRRLLVQRGDAELVALDPDSGATVRFPVPWPRGFGTVTVSPDDGTAVFAGVHAVRCVAATGAVVWEVRHGCWAGECPVTHGAFVEYADDEEHGCADSGSAAFSADGKLVWAHVRGPLAGDGDVAADEEPDELWLVLDAADGRVMGRVSTGTVASGSFHTSHPDPAQMGLSIGEGEEGSPALWGRWDGRGLSVRTIGDETVLLDVSPSGRRLLTTDVQQDALYLHAVEDGARSRDLDAEGAVARLPGGGRVYWDFEAAFADEDTIVAGTSGSDGGHGPARHWLVDTAGMTLRGGITYPHPVAGPVGAAGDGAWYTVSEDRRSVHVWALTDGA